jgi:UDP-3-O-[3-hydroxymyristoyl] glucosamine N-acyltransferase
MSANRSVNEIIEFLGLTPGKADLMVEGIAPLGEVGTSQLTFVTDPIRSAVDLARAMAAGAIVLFPNDSQSPDIGHGMVIRVDNPRAAFAAVVQKFFAPVVVAGIASTAIIHVSAHVANSASIGHFTVIGADVIVGEGVEIRNHVVIGERVVIGDACLIKSHAVIGEEGFGIDRDASGNNVRLPHLGSVRLGSHVEVGNFTTVCSGTITPTVVGDYTKIDDHVHVAHNCRIGRNVVITACAELSGSITMEDDVWIGPNASLIQGISVGKNALIGIGAVVTKSVPANEVQFGNPARRFRDNN